METFWNVVLWVFCTIVLSCLVPLKEEVFLDSQFLLVEQVAAEGKRAFAKNHLMHQLCLFLDQEALLIVTHLSNTLEYFNGLYIGLPLKNVQRLKLTWNIAS